MRLPIRGVAQSGSALHWGCSGHRFKSCRPDQKIVEIQRVKRPAKKWAFFISQFKSLLSPVFVDGRGLLIGGGQKVRCTGTENPQEDNLCAGLTPASCTI